MSRTSKPSLGVVTNKTPNGLQSAELARTCSAIVDALTATVISAQAGLDWLNAEPPDLEEVRRTLNSIADNTIRAGEIVTRLRTRMGRTPTADDDFDPSS